MTLLRFNQVAQVVPCFGVLLMNQSFSCFCCDGNVLGRGLETKDFSKAGVACCTLAVATLCQYQVLGFATFQRVPDQLSNVNFPGVFVPAMAHDGT